MVRVDRFFQQMLYRTIVLVSQARPSYEKIEKRSGACGCPRGMRMTSFSLTSLTTNMRFTTIVARLYIRVYSATEQESRFFYNLACTLILICNEPK